MGLHSNCSRKIDSLLASSAFIQWSHTLVLYLFLNFQSSINKMPGYSSVAHSPEAKMKLKVYSMQSTRVAIITVGTKILSRCIYSIIRCDLLSSFLFIFFFFSLLAVHQLSLSRPHSFLPRARDITNFI